MKKKRNNKKKIKKKKVRWIWCLSFFDTCVLLPYQTFWLMILIEPMLSTDYNINEIMQAMANNIERWVINIHPTKPLMWGGM